MVSVRPSLSKISQNKTNFKVRIVIATGGAGDLASGWQTLSFSLLDCQDVSEEISSNDSDGSDCVPPPLPPRSESLKLQEKLHSLLKDDSSTDPTEISDPPDSEAAAHSENVQVNGNGGMLNISNIISKTSLSFLISG